MAGIPAARVVAVIAELDTRKTQVGSGYLVSATHVLTARHCTLDKETLRAATRLSVRRASDGATATAVLSEASPLDVALLALHPDSSWDAGLPGEPVTFGKVVRDHTALLNKCEAVGYPLWQGSDVGKYRDVAELHGQIRALEGMEEQRLVLRDLGLAGTGRARARVEAAGQSKWGGMSGAAVIYRGRLLGVIIEHHPRQGETALQVRPVDAIAAAADDATRRLGAALGIDRPGALQPVTEESPEVSADGDFGPSGKALSDALQTDAEREALYEQFSLARFQGCARLIEKINDIVASGERSWIVIEGAAGTGKSTLVTHLVDRNKHKGWFLHSTSVAGGKVAESVWNNLAAQLIRAFKLDERKFDPSKGPVFLAQVIRGAARARVGATRDQPIVLVVDSLNEIVFPEHDENPAQLPSANELPPNVFVIVTRRPALEPASIGSPVYLATIETGVIRKLGTKEILDAGDGSNERDMQDYLRKLLEGEAQDANLARKLREYDLSPDEFIQRLVPRCVGVWLFFDYVLPEIRKANRNPLDIIRQLPPELSRYYTDEIRKQLKSNPDQWERFRLPALATLAAMRRPVSRAELVEFSGIHNVAVRDLMGWLEEDIRQLLNIRKSEGGWITYEIGHPSLREFVADPGLTEYLDDELREAWTEAHARITRCLTPDGEPGLRKWRTADQYVRGTLAEHAAYGKCLDGLLSDPGFLLVCQPSSVLFQRRYVTDGAPAASAYEKALVEWDEPLPDDTERAWRLHVWARKTGAAKLAEACLEIARRTPAVRAAMWTGTVHRTMQAHKDSVNTLTVLPRSDGRSLLASGGSDGRVRLWDPDTGEPRGEFLRAADSGTAPGEEPRSAHDASVTATAALPLSNHQVALVTAARDGMIRLWDPQNRKPLAPDRGGKAEAMAVVRLADGRAALVAIGGDGMRIWHWNAAARLLQAESLASGNDWKTVTAAAAVPAPDGDLLAVGTSGGLVRLWNPQTGKPASDPLTGHKGPVRAIAAVRIPSSDSDGATRITIAAGSQNGMTFWFWDPQANQLIDGPLPVPGDPVNAITVARRTGETLFVAAGRRGKVRLWDAAAANAAPAELPVDAPKVNAIAAISMPDGSNLIATGGKGSIELLDLHEDDSTTGDRATTASAGHADTVTTLTVSSQGNQALLISGSRDGTLRRWYPDTGAPDGLAVADDLGEVLAATALPRSTGPDLIAASAVDGTLRVWDPASTPPKSRQLEHYRQVYALAAVQRPAPERRTLLATGSDDGAVRLWDPETGEQVGELPPGHAGQRVYAITAVDLPDGRPGLATGGGDGTVQFWDPAAGRAFGGPLNGYIGGIKAIAQVVLPDERRFLAAGGADGLVQIWEGTARRGAPFGPPARQRAPVNAITAVELLDSHQALLATGDENGMVRLWDPETGEPAPDLGPWAGHHGPVRTVVSVRLRGGPTLLASGGDDKTILVWTFG